MSTTRAKAQDYQGKITSTDMVTSDVLKVEIDVISPKEKIPLLPGQFINFKVPREGQKPLLRSYSVVSPAENGDKLTLLVDTDPNGPGCQFITQLKVGDKVDFKGPLGVFHLRDESEKDVIIAANVSAVGVGYAVAQAMLKRQPERQVTFLFQLKGEREIFWHQHLLKLSQTYPNFSHIITVADPTDSWAGPSGTLADHLPRYIRDPENTEAYLAGLGPVVNELRDILTKAGIDKKAIAVERFSPAKPKPKRS